MSADIEALVDLLAKHQFSVHQSPRPIFADRPDRLTKAIWGCTCGWVGSDEPIDDGRVPGDVHRHHLADLLAARERRVGAEGDIRDYRAAYSRCVDLAEEWQDLDYEPATDRDLSTLTAINRCGQQLNAALIEERP